MMNKFGMYQRVPTPAQSTPVSADILAEAQAYTRPPDYAAPAEAPPSGSPQGTGATAASDAARTSAAPPMTPDALVRMLGALTGGKTAPLQAPEPATAAPNAAAPNAAVRERKPLSSAARVYLDALHRHETLSREIDRKKSK